ncbi:hypothetical protein EEDFHM_03668 [Methylorubrum populi]
MTEDTVHLHAGAAERPSDGGRPLPSLVQGKDLIPVNSAFPALVDALQLRLCYPLSLALSNEPSLHLSDHSKNRQHNAPWLTAS